jgi:hypothetical protein
MIRIPAGNLFASASSIGGACKFFQVGRRQLQEQGDSLLVVPLGDIMVTIQAAKFLKDASAELGFVACAAAAADFGRIMDRFPTPTRDGLQFNDRQLAELMGALEYLLKTFRDEVDARPMFIMPPGAVELLEQRAPAFGPEVQDAFPSSENDIAEAARCLAMQRYTACVMHLMRALEVPLDALARRCGVEAKANWNTLLNDIEARIRERRSDRDAVAEQWMAEAATHFRFIKNAWRNHAMHARASYDEAQARDIYGSVRSFLQQLAAHLDEEPTEPADEA